MKGTDRKRMWQTAALCCFVCAAAAVGIMLYGRKAPETENTGRQQKETILTVTYASGDEGWNRAVSLAGDAFQKAYPDIRLNLRPSTKTTGGFYDDYLRKIVAADELGDIVELKNTKESIVTKMFTRLPDTLTELTKNNWITPDGSVYTLPLFRLEQGIIYNKAVFERAGISPPKTWQEFEKLCGKLKAQRYTPLVVGAGDSWHLMFWGRYFFNSCVTADNPNWQQDCKLGKVRWTDEQPERMLERYQRLFDQGYVHESYANINDAGACEYIADGRAVMLYALCNQIPKIQSLNPEVKLGWFFMPDDAGHMYSFNDNKSGWAVTAECRADQEKYDAAVKFLELFYSDTVYQEVCNIMNALPVTGKKMKLENELFKEISAQTEQGLIRPDVQLGDEGTPEGFESILYRSLMDLFKGDADRGEIMEKLQTEWENRE